MLVTRWPPNNNPGECVPGPQKGKEQQVPGCLEDAGFRRDSCPKHPSVPHANGSRGGAARESCARNQPSHWLLLLQGTEYLAFLGAAKTLNSAGTASTVRRSKSRPRAEQTSPHP